MPEYDTNERVIGGEVTETPSSNSYIARNLNTIRAEIEAAGKIIDIPSADVLKPRLTISGVMNNVRDEAGKKKQSSGSPLARFASSSFKERQLKKAA